MTRESGRGRPLPRRTMAQELADTLTEEIVAGRMKPGDALPTEPELSAEFSVSRSVVRDATRVLAARGLITVHHGRGAYVTDSQIDAFSDALLLALRREGATVWDVEEFFAHLWPVVFGMAAERAEADELAAIRRDAEVYLERFETLATAVIGTEREATPGELESLRESFAGFLRRVLAATDNQVFALLASPLQRLRSLRNWSSPDATVRDTVRIEREGVMRIVTALESRDGNRAREAVSRWFDLPPEAVTAMKETPVAELVRIPVSITTLARNHGTTPKQPDR